MIVPTMRMHNDTRFILFTIGTRSIPITINSRHVYVLPAAKLNSGNMRDRRVPALKRCTNGRGGSHLFLAPFQQRRVSALQELNYAWKCDGGDGCIKWELLIARVDNIEVVECEILLSYAHGFRGGWSIGVFELEAETTAFMDNHEVELSTTVRAPEECIAISAHIENLLHAEAFPRSPKFGVRLQSRVVVNSKECMEKT